MSRSRKKTPRSGDRKHNKEIANRKVRRHLDVASGGYYKRMYCQYDICDYESHMTFEEYCNFRLNLLRKCGHAPLPTVDELKQSYEKYYIRK